RQRPQLLLGRGSELGRETHGRTEHLVDPVGGDLTVDPKPPSLHGAVSLCVAAYENDFGAGVAVPDEGANLFLLHTDCRTASVQSFQSGLVMVSETGQQDRGGTVGACLLVLCPLSECDAFPL